MKPNILVIFPDQMCHFLPTQEIAGHRVCPNLERLFSQAVVFDHAYCAQSLCTPARGSLLTGLYPHQHGLVVNNVNDKMFLPDYVKCFPELVRDTEYRAAYIGKWHLGNEHRPQRGFHHWVSTENYGAATKTRSAYDVFLEKKGFKRRDGKRLQRHDQQFLPLKLRKPFFQAGTFKTFVKNQTAPWICFVSPLEPHPPMVAPIPSWMNFKDIIVPDNVCFQPNECFPSYVNKKINRIQKSGFHQFCLETEEGWQKLIAAYWSNAYLVDLAVGRMLEFLKAEGIYENTLIVFTSDHGSMMGSHGLAAKDVQYENAIRVPLAIKLPGHPIPQTVSTNVSQVDIVPTVLGVMDEMLPKNLPGTNILKLAENLEKIPGEPIYVERNSLQMLSPSPINQPAGERFAESQLADPIIRTVINQNNWKLNLSNTHENELFDLNTDPLEMKNLFNDAKYKTIRDSLRCNLKEWQEKTSDAENLSIQDKFDE